MIHFDGHLVFTALGAGLLGGAVMELVMWLVARAGLARGDMLLALGGLITRRRTKAHRVGLLVHAVAALFFGLAYTLGLVTFGVTVLPDSFILGLAVGTFHGIVVSLMLVWVVADHHPLEEFQEADLLVGLTHVAGHAAYGAVVGLVVGLASV
ncbi:MAG: hypothetical protein C0518_06315 [Opitutus sp.]|nr:hypothetical protein [Opitutus sp.]